MSRLTREEIEYLRAELKWQVAGTHKPVPVIDIDALCDLALQSLFQEAVRDEAEAALRFYAGEVDGQHWGEAMLEDGGRRAKAAISALKREPNAASFDMLAELKSRLAEPAPAAPDVASMVKRLENGEIQVATMYEGEWVRDMDAAREIAALLAKLWQGWIPPETVLEIDEDGRVHPEDANLKNLRPGASDD